MSDRERTLLGVIETLTRALIASADQPDERVARSVELAASWPTRPDDDALWRSSACECERWRNGATMCPVHGTYRPDLQCGAVAVQCLPWGKPGACPREGHEHPPCTYGYPHVGPHSWQTESHDNRDASDPHAKPEIAFELVGRPVTESRVRDRYGVVWLCLADGTLTPLYVPEDRENDPHPWVQLGIGMEWFELLGTRGRVVLVDDDQDDEDAALYGPRGARWGNPQEPCPFPQCALGLNHSGPHRDQLGDALGETEADGSRASVGISPHDASETPCTCGHPEAHQPECPRYARISGVPTPRRPGPVIDATERGYDEEPPF